LKKKNESALYRHLLEDYFSEFEMSCPKTGRLYEGRLIDQSLTPVRYPGYNEFTMVGIFTIELNLEEEQGLVIKTLHAVREWLNQPENNPENIIFRVNLNGLREKHLLGSLVDASSTSAYIRKYFGQSPFFGNDNPGILSSYVDLEKISVELAELVGYTIISNVPVYLRGH
jgi:hypothetical protein